MNLLKSPRRRAVILRARCDDLDAARAVCERIGAEERGASSELDTYFTLGRQRLKLRESSGGKHWLVGYSQSGWGQPGWGASGDAPSAWESSSDDAETPKSDGAERVRPHTVQYRREPVVAPRAVRAMLARQWGVKCEVHIERLTFGWAGRVRIHLDRIDRLGWFVELEAELGPEGSETEEASAFLDLARLSHDFGWTARDVIASSYATLVRQATQTPAGT